MTFKLTRESLDMLQKYTRDSTERVFCNRSLSLDNIQFFGFDMDYTLAVYKSPQYEELAFGLTIDRLIDEGYSPELRRYKYDPTFPLRGLLFDTLYGNLLKVDTHGNILVAIHGKKFLIGDDLRNDYPNKYIKFEKMDRFKMFNTLFSLPEVYLLSCLVDYFDGHSEYTKTRNGVSTSDIFISYKTICQDIRNAVDWVHIWGSLKSETIKNPEKYVAKDSRLPKLLYRMRKAGKKTFLLTNSDFKYTKAIMTYLCDFPHGPEADVPQMTWKELFDMIIVSAKKPTFFGQGTPLRQVDENTGQLRIGSYTGKHSPDRVYSGGNSEDLHELLNAEGKNVLYIGDHIFGDILKSKKQNGWRTYLVVPELTEELDVWTHKPEQFNQLHELEVKLAKKYKNLDSNHYDHIDISELKNDIKETVHGMEMCYGQLGSLFRSGSRNTFFASQAMRYADLYATSCVNLLYYPFSYLFRAQAQLMPHEATVHQEKSNKSYGPLENARRSNSILSDQGSMNYSLGGVPVTEDHEIDEDNRSIASPTRMITSDGEMTYEGISSEEEGEPLSREERNGEVERERLSSGYN